MNRIQLIGNLGQDPELKYTQTGTALATFNIAVNEKNKEGETTTEWFRCVCFGKKAEFVSETLSKGAKVYVEGKLKSWQNGDGKKYWSVNAWQVVAFQVKRDAIETKEIPEPEIDEDIPF